MSYVENPPNNSLYQGVRITAWGLVLRAYGVDIGDLLEGLPNWAMTTKFDITAKSDSSSDEALAKLSEADAYAEKRIMLQHLLEDRFKLKIHLETRTATTYELVATDRTPKLMKPVQGESEATVSTCTRHFSQKGMEVVSKGCPFSIFLSEIKQDLGTNVVDHTGLSGMYAYHLTWRFGTSSETLQDGGERYPLLVDALDQQMGLKLKQAKGPVTFWIVDHIELPTPN